MINRLFSTFTNCFKAAMWTSSAPGSNGSSEDAFVVSDKLISICDGLGTWKAKGVDPGKYSWQLARNIEKAYSFLPEEVKYHPQAILRQAVKDTTEFGSSTCTLAIIHPEKPQVYVGNIGDSGMMILRKMENDVVKIGQTRELVEKFDKPYTLGSEGKNPDEADYEIFEVKDKDIVLLYSDGVSHNLQTDQVIRIVKPFMLLHEIPDLEIIAEMITEKAQAVSVDDSVEKPYGIEIGDAKVGKINDATVVIAEVSFKDINV